MGKFGAVPVLLLVCSPSTPALCGIAEEISPPQVTVNVYNGIHLAPSDLERAEREAERIFLYAGIRVVWTSGKLATDAKPAPLIVGSKGVTLQLRVWTRAIAEEKAVGYETLGFCLSRENGEVVVLADAIQKRAVVGTTKFTDLLGLAMAHELGHVLLRSMSHSVTGVMQARWTEKCLREDERGFLRFTAGEAVLMREEVRRRMVLKRQVASIP